MAVIGRMKIATWNVNSIRQRESHVKRWLERVQPDLLFLQEIKCETAAFPALTFQAVGYQSDAVGQKAYNGVAVLSRVPFQVVHRTLPGLPEDDAQSRYIEVEAARPDADRDLSAERQFPRRGGLRLQDGLDGPAGGARANVT